MSKDHSTGMLLKRLESLHTDSLLKLQEEFSTVMAEISLALVSPDTKLPDVADIGYLSREISVIFDHMRLEAQARQALAGKRIAVTLTERSLSDPNVSTTVKGQIASATPDVKIESILPRAGTPEMQEFLKWIGVDPLVVESGMVKPDWKVVQEHINRLQEDGKPLPPGIGKTYPRFHSIFRRNRS